MAEPNGSSTKQQESDPGVTATQQKPRLTKNLPTDRINFTKQLDILRAWASASIPQGKIVSNTEVANLVKLNSSTVSLANPFFSSIGLLTKQEGGYVPSAEVFAYLRAIEWMPDTAAYKLAPAISESWFWQKLLPPLTFKSITEDAAVAMLADEANATPDYRNQLKLLIEYLVAAGLVQRDGELLKMASNRDSALEPSKPQEATTATTAPPKQNVTTSFVQSQEGAINFHISVRVNMEEFSTWRPDRITAFFGGIAQMLAAKAKIEGGSE